MNCPICSWTSDNPDYLLISEMQYWRICLAPNQSLLGRCVIHLKRHAGDLADLNDRELLEFLSVIKTVETSIKSAFEATMFNWSCYMNLSYRESPPDPHVHWWAVPRYNHKVEFDGQIFEDSHFGNPYDHYRVLNLAQKSRLQIARRIKEEILFLKEKSL